VLIDEKKRLERASGKIINGFRSHFLKIKIPDTWEFLRDAGFQHDSTLGFYDCSGFRNGMCYPFKPYNLNNRSVIDIIEIPLIIQDITLDAYMRLNLEDAWNLTQDLIDKTEKNHGVITISWHNNTFISKSHAKFYENILKYCKKKKAWMTNAGNIAAFWKENEKI
jgi:hypothetical protein